MKKQDCKEMDPATVTIVIPLFNEEENVKRIVTAVSETLRDICSFDFVLVDDGSTDNTLIEIEKISNTFANVSYLSFSRNFGHQNALRAGLDFAGGDAVVTMDGDLQHPPELLPEMIQKWQEGYDIVFTVREQQRQQSWFKQLSSDLFYRLLNLVSGIGIHAGAADFRLLDRKVVDVLIRFTEGAVFYRGIISWVGYRQFSISYKPNKRVYGETKYSMRKMFRLAADGVTSFSFLPLRLAALIGSVIAFLSFIYVCYAISLKLFTDQTVSGWVSVMSGVYLLGGIQLIFIGLCGEYIGRIFMEVKGRPHYIIAQSRMCANSTGKKHADT